MNNYPVVVIGGGPAGLTAAYELTKQGVASLVLEKADKVGGIARTELYKNYRFDIGGHRFYTKVEEIQNLWQEMMGEDLIKVPRLSRIYYQGKFFDYPLSISNTLVNLGPFYSFLCILSYLKARIKVQLQPKHEAESFEEWVVERFGRRLYLTFFKTYTEKVWGLSCDRICAEWAAQRITGLSLAKVIIDALSSKNNIKTLTKEFYYPILGPGMMWERFQQTVENRGSLVQLNTNVISIQHDGKRIESITTNRQGQTQQITAENFISSIPITTIVKLLTPHAPGSVIKAAKSLTYRDFLIVALIIDAEDLFPDNWIYIHDSGLKVGRIQNFKNWSSAMVPDSSKTCLGLEYFCNQGDSIWQQSEQELIQLATSELVKLKLAQEKDIVDGTVIRQPKAYPVYDFSYRQNLQIIREYLSGFENLQTIGRNGMHRYNNQDHSMLTGMLAAQNLTGAKHDLWQVNTERSYYEEFQRPEKNLSYVTS